MNQYFDQHITIVPIYLIAALQRFHQVSSTFSNVVAFTLVDSKYFIQKKKSVFL